MKSIDSPNPGHSTTFEEFVEAHKQILVAYYALGNEFGSRVVNLSWPSFQRVLSEAELGRFRAQLIGRMPKDSKFFDLCGWNDEQGDGDLSDEWLYEAAFGPPDSVGPSAVYLADWLRSCEETDGMDCNEHSDPASCESKLDYEALAFIVEWRERVFADLARVRTAPYVRSAPAAVLRTSDYW